MMRILSIVLCSVLLALSKSATAHPSLQARAVTELSHEDFMKLAPFAQFARATYCDLKEVKAWKCGMWILAVV